MTHTHTGALQVLSNYSGPCLDMAIESLERFARSDARVFSDVSAAYMVRAQRDDRASDLLRAMDTAQKGVDVAPQSSAARFNLALAQEALGLHAEAIESWDAVRRLESGDWATEATEHRNRLALMMANEAATRWPRHKQQLETVDPSDRATVARLIGPFPFAAQKYVEEELLPRWDLTRAKAIGQALYERNGDRYVLDIATAAEKTPALREAHAEFARARLAERALRYGDAGRAYRRAAALLTRGQSPLSLSAQLGEAIAIMQVGAGSMLPILDRIERTATERRYLQLIGHVRTTRALELSFENHHVLALDEYKRAAEHFAAIGDRENVANSYRGRGGVYRYAGHVEEAWRLTFRSREAVLHSVEPQGRHHIYGESARTALQLGHPMIALAYQRRGLRILQSALAVTPPEQRERVQGLQQNVSMALRHKADIEKVLGNTLQSQRDLNEAIRLSHEAEDQSARNALLARAQEIAARVTDDPHDSIAAFSRAVELTAERDYQAFRAALYAGRAKAYRRIGNTAAAEADLKTALKVLADEEARMLATRQRGHEDELWRLYFSRFEDIYQEIISLYVTTGRPREAFVHAERARATEPLDLLLRQRQVVPEEFAKLAREDVDLRRIQERIPDGTFLIQYSVHEHETYVWVISRRQFHSDVLQVRRNEIRDWAARLYSVAGNDGQYFELASAVYARLIAKPLSRIPERPDRKLVFIPDGPLHAIPIAALRNDRQYVVERDAIAFSASARLYLWSLQRDAELPRERVPSALLVGNPPDARLPRAESEVRTIARHYASKMLLGENATVADFLRLARQSSVVHVAAHAYADAESPSRSHIALAPSNDEDGELRADELSTRLEANKARIFVLSACKSAGGSPVGPEGVAPLVRPLIVAGVPAVVGSLWDVHDAAAERLLVRFHEHLRDGKDAAKALQAAQLDLLRGNRASRSVLTWGALQVIGHARSPFVPPPEQN